MAGDVRSRLFVPKATCAGCGYQFNEGALPTCLWADEPAGRWEIRIRLGHRIEPLHVRNWQDIVANAERIAYRLAVAKQGVAARCLVRRLIRVLEDTSHQLSLDESHIAFAVLRRVAAALMLERAMNLRRKFLSGPLPVSSPYELPLTTWWRKRARVGGKDT